MSDEETRYSLDTPEYHAQRIASLINLINNNIIPDIIMIYIMEDGTFEIDDGHHRLRAYMYLNMDMPVAYQ